MCCHQVQHLKRAGGEREGERERRGEEGKESWGVQKKERKREKEQGK